MRKKANREANPFSRMTSDQLRSATAEFDGEMIHESFGPLTPSARTKWRKARQRPGRPRRGEGAKMISVTVERGLLAQSDALAKNMGVTRAGLIERGLRAVLAAEGKL